MTGRASNGPQTSEARQRKVESCPERDGRGRKPLSITTEIYAKTRRWAQRDTMPSIVGDKLDYGDDHRWWYDGKLFSGEAEYFEKGRLVERRSFRVGPQHGTTISWHDNGQLRSSESFWGGGLHGESIHWYANGVTKAKMTYEYGVLLEKECWDENGNQVESYVIDHDSWEWKYVQSLREKAKEDGMGNSLSEDQ